MFVSVRKAGLLCGLVALLAGCGGSTSEGAAGGGGSGAAGVQPSGPVAQPDFGRMLASAVCGSVAPCCEKAGLTFTASACQTLINQQVGQGIGKEANLPGVTYDADAAAKCIAATQQIAGECDPSAADQAAWLSACNAVVTGATSHDSEDCGSSGASCPVDPIGGATGKAGDPCFGTSVTDSSGANEGASSGSGIASGTGGSSSGPPANATVCSVNDGLYCDQTKFVCVATIADGAACSVYETWCTLASHCVNSVCVPRGGVGTTCTDSSDCQDGINCSFSKHLCVAPAPSGTACGDEAECQSGICSSGACAPTILFGESTCDGQTHDSSQPGSFGTGGAGSGSNSSGMSNGNATGGSSG